MDRFPIDGAQLQIHAVEVRPDLRDGNQKTRPDGRLVWAVACLVRFEGRVPEMVTVKVPSATPLKLAEMTRVEFGGLYALFWETGGRAGVSWQAETVSPVGAAK
jgi:hypothetical protein